jgi:hypothetical protein
MKVKLEVHKLQQNQQHSQPMYGIEPLFIDQESFLDSETQMTPYDASLYESITVGLFMSRPLSGGDI